VGDLDGCRNACAAGWQVEEPPSRWRRASGPIMEPWSNRSWSEHGGSRRPPVAVLLPAATTAIWTCPSLRSCTAVLRARAPLVPPHSTRARARLGTPRSSGSRAASMAVSRAPKSSGVTYSPSTSPSPSPASATAPRIAPRRRSRYPSPGCLPTGNIHQPRIPTRRLGAFREREGFVSRGRLVMTGARSRGAPVTGKLDSPRRRWLDHQHSRGRRAGRWRTGCNGRLEPS
jgi:hypothetical protein